MAFFVCDNMKIHFHKYQGTGNDFILIDNRDLSFPADNTELITRLCDRKWGIGADGLMLIQNSPDEDFEMVFFNPDASKSLCGNGSRCAITFAKDLGIIEKQTSFITTDGKHGGTLDLEKGLVSFEIRDIEKVEEKGDNDYFIFNGSPHHIRFVDNIDEVEIGERGPEVRYHRDYAPGGTNVNFASIENGSLKVRTYERGVEDETLSCGTGVVATAIAASFKGMDSPISIETKGGQLSVNFTREEDKFSNIFLQGPAKKVFEGTFEV